MERYTVITVDMDTAGIGSAAGGLQRTLQQLQQTTEEAFSGNAVVRYVKTTTGALTKLRNSLTSVKRSLAGFDQLQRLDKPETVKTTSTKKTASSTDKNKSGTQLLLEYLKGTDVRQELAILQAVRTSVERCNTAVQLSLARRDQLHTALKAEILQLNLDTAAWSTNEAVRVSVAAAQNALTVATVQWRNICTIAGVETMNLKAALQALELTQSLVSQGFGQMRQEALTVNAAWQMLHHTGEQLCGGLRSAVQQLGQSFQLLYARDMLLGMQRGVSATAALLRMGLEQMLTFTRESFAPGWHSAWQSIALDFQTVMGAMPSQQRIVANRMISVFNNMLTAIAGGMNGLINSMNQIRLSAGPAGLKVGKLPTVTAPRIPYLAQGAVLPANRPFLAMVGDQRHGTNIEAPLTTIQEAMSLVMGDQTAAIMAGFEASVGVQKEILEAVLGIQIGDDVIGRASQRYARKMAVVRGGSI